ncbi:MAG: PQQ-dependent sugar dehydrogenase [Actinomycetota bacterium]
MSRPFELRRLLAVATGAAVSLMVACSPPEEVVERAQDPPPQASPTVAGDLVAERLPFELDFGVDMAWERGTDRIFVTEKNTGAIRVVVDGELLDRPCARLDVETDLLQGLTGIVLHPQFAENGWLYVYNTNRQPHENRVTRFTVRGNRCIDPEPIITGIEPSRVHNGGQLAFVDGKLFVTVGEANVAAYAQDLDSLLGKILRYNDDGTIPDGNPFSEPGAPSPVWSYGHRNPFGLAHRPGTDQLFATENGPNCDDELNLIEPGVNYGWGKGHECGEDGVGEDPVGPLIRWDKVIVPTDLWWYEGRIESLQDTLLMAEYVGGTVHSFTLSDDGRTVISDDIVYSGDEKLVGVSEGPGGWVYFVTQTSMYRMTHGTS